MLSRMGRSYFVYIIYVYYIYIYIYLYMYVFFDDLHVWFCFVVPNGPVFKSLFGEGWEKMYISSYVGIFLGLQKLFIFGNQ